MGELLHSFPTIFAQAEAHAGGHESTSYWGLVVYVVFTLAVLFGLIAYAKKGLGQRVFKNPITQLAEQMYLFIENMCVNTIGAHGRKYVPIIGTFWLVIFVGNSISLFFANAVTAELSFNIAMALIAVGYVQYEGIRTNGIIGHFKHFAGPKLDWYMAILITPMIFLIEIVSELMKNVSLSLRLFGNIHGGHEAVEAMNRLGQSAYIPVGGFLLLIKLLTVVVQALIFTLLTCVYLSLVTGHGDDHGHEEHSPAPAH
jgi:F-type H+-transporting ATPase subunit a